MQGVSPAKQAMLAVRNPKMKKMYAEGVPIKEIAFHFMVNRNVVADVLKGEPRFQKRIKPKCYAQARSVHLGTWNDVDLDSLIAIVPKMKGDETLIACMIRLLKAQV